jgi:hypothetical protein
VFQPRIGWPSGVELFLIVSVLVSFALVTSAFAAYSLLQALEEPIDRLHRHADRTANLASTPDPCLRTRGIAVDRARLSMDLVWAFEGKEALSKPMGLCTSLLYFSGPTN